MRASTLLSDADRARIDEAIRLAESETSGEIVPVVAGRSGRYERAAAFAGVAVAVIGLWVAWVLMQTVVQPTDRWDIGPYPALGLLPIVGIVVGGFFVGRFVMQRVGWLLRAFSSHREMLGEVVDAAEDAFFACHAHRTEDATGVVLYASLLERLVVVRGDTAIAEKLTDADWSAIRDALAKGLRDGRPADAFVDAIERTGQLLAKHFPANADDTNELHDRIHVID